MQELIESFSAQMEYGLREYSKIQHGREDKRIENIIICGMGGSGVGGLFVQSFCSEFLHIPIWVSNEYSLPLWVGENTLVICSSYSGNTEETLYAFDEAVAKGAQLVVVTSGGTLEKKAKEEGIWVQKIPLGCESPRACLGYSFFAQMTVLKKQGLLGLQEDASLHQLVSFLEKEIDNTREKGKALAPYLLGKKVVIYSSKPMEPAGIRFRQQLNENSKSLGWVSVFPEMNHNELVGWSKNEEHLLVLLLKSSKDHPRTQLRMKICKEIFSHFSHLIEIPTRGETKIEELFYLVSLLDWASYYLALEKGVDPVSIPAIHFLKNQLAEN
jgi:glucose/mannose-6-phosphate isomerase